MLGVTVPDIHRSLDKAVQATVIPAARVRGIYIDAARLEQYEQALVTAAIGGDTRRRLRRRCAFRSGRRRFPASTRCLRGRARTALANTTAPSSARPGCSPKVRATRERAALSVRIGSPRAGLAQEHRAENSHQPTRRRERKMQRFKSPGSAQRFLSVHAAVQNTFNVQRHLTSRRTLRVFREEAFQTWRAATAA